MSGRKSLSEELREIIKDGEAKVVYVEDDKEKEKIGNVEEIIKFLAEKVVRWKRITIVPK